MSFTSVITDRPKAIGHERMSRGTWEGDGDSGGNIDTGLRKCHFIKLTPKGSAGPAAAPAVDETLPCDGSAVTVALGEDCDGYWEAWGY